MQFERADRVSEEVKKQISGIIQNELKDPRISADLISVIKVNMSKDLKYAKVFISIFDKDKEKIDKSYKALINSIPYIRREITKRLKLRVAPEITFELDDSIEYGARISQILEQLNIPKEENNEDTTNNEGEGEE